MSTKERRRVGFELKVLCNLIVRNEANNKMFRKLENLTGMHGFVIGYIAHHPERDIFQRDLEQHFSIRRSTASKLVALMIQNGLLTCEPVSYDARLKKLVLTDKAKELNVVIEREIELMEKQTTKGLSEEEINSFFEIADKIRANLERVCDGDDVKTPYRNRRTSKK